MACKRVIRKEYDQWRKRLQLMAAQPFAWPYSATWYKCGEYYAVKIKFPADMDASIVMLALQNYARSEKLYYADVERLGEKWMLYKEVERIISELSKAGEL